MKKYIIGMTIASAVFLAACGSEDTSNQEQGEKGTETEEVAAEETAAESIEEVAEEETVTEVEEETEDEPAEEVESEDIIEDEDIRVENVFTDKELNISGATGPIEYSIDAIQFKKILAKSDYAAEMFGVVKGDTVEGFAIQYTGENTAEEDITFYLGQAKAITSTKEQLEPDYFLSDYIDGEYLGQVQQTGYLFYPLKNSSVDDIETIEIRVSAPQDSNYDNVGEEVVQTISIER